MTAPPTEPESSDEELMLLVGEGDAVAFRELVERHQRLVIGLVVRMIGSSDAEDVAQKVFLNVWKSAPRWRPEAKFTTWLLTIAKRLVFNESRRRVRSRLLPQASEEREEVDYPDTSSGPDRRLLEAELHEAIEAAIAKLPEKERLALVLRQYQEMPYDEIAIVLGVSLPAVKSLLFRARNTMKELLASYLSTETRT